MSFPLGDQDAWARISTEALPKALDRGDRKPTTSSGVQGVDQRRQGLPEAAKSGRYEFGILRPAILAGRHLAAIVYCRRIELGGCSGISAAPSNVDSTRPVQLHARSACRHRGRWPSLLGPQRRDEAGSSRRTLHLERPPTTCVSRAELALRSRTGPATGRADTPDRSPSCIRPRGSMITLLRLDPPARVRCRP